MRTSVVNVKGGVGKTTTAVYLAALLSETAPVILIDADPQATAAEWLEETPLPGVQVAARGTGGCPGYRWLPGVQVVEAPSERLVARAVELAGQATVLLDTPPGVERLVRAAINHSDAVVIPTRVGGLEVARVQATVGMLPPDLPRGLVVIAAKTRTRDYRETLHGWTEAGVPVWASVPERVGIASGPDGHLHPDGLAAYRPVLGALTLRLVT